MTRDDIIRLAREASGESDYDFPNIFSLERFAALVAAAEREACAKVCHDYATRHGLKGDDNEKAQAWMMLQCVAAIRARGDI
jgi:hypothetical protein